MTARADFSFFHGSAWAKVLAESYGFTPVYFTAGKADEIKSVLPLMEVNSWLTGRRGIGLPFTDECEPLGTNSKTFQELFQTAVEFGKTRGWKSIECRGGRKLFGEAPASLSFYGHVVQLVSDADKQFEKMDSSVRRAVRKAEKDGVTVVVSQSLDATRDFYSLQCRTRKRHGLPPQPFSFFLNVHRHILSQNRGMVAVASHGGRKIAAAVYFFLGGRAIYKYGASDLAHQHLRANNLVMWEAIKWLARKGATQLDLGKTSLAHEGLRRFKLQFGATEHAIEYLKFDLQQAKYVIETDGVAGWHNRVFRAMPVFMSRLAGSLLYKHWA